MRDISNERIIEINGVKYSVDRTFDGSPAVFQHIKDGSLHHIDDVNAKTHVSSITIGSDDMVIILARKVK